MKRNEQLIENTWKIEDIYPNLDVFYKELEEAKKQSKELLKYKDHLTNASSLYAYLKGYEELNEKLYTLDCYTSLLSDQDGSNAFYQDLKGKANVVITEIHSQQAFFEVEVLKLSDVETYFEKEPGLERYRRFIQDIYRLKPYTLSMEKEELLAGCQDIFSSSERAFYILNDVDTRFEDVKDAKGNVLPLTSGSYVDYLESADETLRKSAFENMYAAYGKVQNTMASLLNSQCKMLKYESDLRGYPTSLEASTNKNGVPSSVYKNLIKQVHKDIAPLHKYMKVRKKALKKDKLNMYDLYVPLVKEFDKKITFETAKKEALASVALLGQEYVEAYEKGLNSRWIDVYENEGKRSGAYSSGQRVHPFVLMNFANSLDTEFTLAHEMGHAMHSYMSTKYQAPLDRHYKIFVAEVASTCNEALLMDYLRKQNSDSKFQAYLINHFMEQFRTTLFRQCMFAEFEKIINEKTANNEVLTSDTLNQIYADLNKFYYGEDVIVDDEISMEWARIPHFYMNFYVYQYATGFSAAMALSQKLLHGTQADIEAYLSFLKSGCTKSPVELLRMAGVDMASPKPVEDAIELFDSLIDEFESIMK